MTNRTIQSELELFKKTGNSTHARWVANELINAQADSKFASIEKQLDVTVGHASGGDIKSSLLWAVLDLATAGERKLRDELEKERARNYGFKTRSGGVAMERIKIDKESRDQIDRLFSEFVAGSARRHHEELHGTFKNYPHMMQNEIMKEALMEIRNRGRKWPEAGEIAKNALDKAKSVNQ
ncbi:hypothetical protein C0J08_14755 [Marinomonas sp. CT5]|uniref:hypothetical protein n=1 Tax=Marinomonas sp. CT5 TaxID=2066133 RepID=UPI001BAFD0C2|nr:hypothetical protein [Marinomonas sp. CT5]QUX96581.1 hypothetical protein C0J08_14755 [Marinomonas sp. CT5]